MSFFLLHVHKNDERCKYLKILLYCRFFTPRQFETCSNLEFLSNRLFIDAVNKTVLILLKFIGNEIDNSHELSIKNIGHTQPFHMLKLLLFYANFFFVVFDTKKQLVLHFSHTRIMYLYFSILILGKHYLL